MIQVMKLLWTSDSAEFDGEYFQYKGGALLRPRPVQDPHPPIIIGVNIEGRALDIAMKHADEINTWQLGPDAVSKLAAAIESGCDRMGRPRLRVTSDVLLLKDADESAARELVANIQKGARAGG